MTTLASFLARIPDEGLEPLKVSLGERSKALASSRDPEATAWASLYEFLRIEIECARLIKLGVNF